MFKELLISGAIVLLSGYRYYMHKPEDIECVSYEVKSRKIPKVFDKFKIVQISDLHNRSFGIDNSILLEKIDKLKPDIVCITGDLIDGANEDFSIALKLIDELSRKYQVYHIIGNHEQKVMFNKYKELYKEYFKQLNTKNIINLENEMVKIERDSVNYISTHKEKVKKLFDLVSKNNVSPIHLIDVIGEYVDEYVSDFN